jgi:hypothetical protein
MQIAGVGCALPPHCHDQGVLTRALRDYWGERLDRPQLLDRLHGRLGVDRRHLAFRLDEYPELSPRGRANAAWPAAAQTLGEVAIGAACARAATSFTRGARRCSRPSSGRSIFPTGISTRRGIVYDAWATCRRLRSSWCSKT